MLLVPLSVVIQMVFSEVPRAQSKTQSKTTPPFFGISYCRSSLLAAMLFVYLYVKRTGGGLSLFGTTGAQRGASADIKEKTDFYSNISM